MPRELSTGYTVEFVSEKNALSAVGIRTAWSEGLSRSANLRVALQTPPWARFRSGGSGRFQLALIRGATAEIIGVCPFLREDYSLPFLGDGTHFRARFKGLLLMGNDPLMPDDASAYAALFQALSELRDVDIVYALNVGPQTRFGLFLNELGERGEDWFLYRYPPCLSHRIDMDKSFEAYSQRQFSSHQRQNHKREARILRDRAGHGQLELVRVTELAEVRDFLNQARAIAGRSWQKMLIGRSLDEDDAARMTMLEEMAADRFLRCYMLRCGGAVCAYNVGFQVNGTFHFHETAFDPAFAHGGLSPGKVLLCQMIHDLFAFNPPLRIYFGPGDQPYKRWFANRQANEVTMLLLREQFLNRAKITAHESVRSVVRFAKRISRPALTQGSAA